jgi:uncharacterized protein (DUF983 family)
MPIAIRDTGDAGKRSAWASIKRGLRGRCPNCGKGRLFQGYLTPVAACSVCGEDLSHQRSDDFAPYLTIVAVGHLIVPLILFGEFNPAVSPVLLLALALPATGISALLFLRPIKGAIIGLQWALRMHGFDGSTDPDAPAAVLAFPPGVRPFTKTG